MKNIIVILLLFILFGTNFFLVFLGYSIILLFDSLLRFMGLYKKGLGNELKEKLLIFESRDANTFFIIGSIIAIVWFVMGIINILDSVSVGFNLFSILVICPIVLIGSYYISKRLDE